MVGGASEPPGLFYKALIPFMWVHPYDLATSQRPHFQIPSHWALEFNMTSAWAHSVDSEHVGTPTHVHTPIVNQYSSSTFSRWGVMGNPEKMLIQHLFRPTTPLCCTEVHSQEAFLIPRQLKFQVWLQSNSHVLCTCTRSWLSTKLHGGKSACMKRLLGKELHGEREAQCIHPADRS